ncbi:MAG: HipA N-terminal domain-containing protein [Legionella sp.]|uniref:HipA N-terminal domain-containing protein n=1 Tax=Legionella sp. TaxID=459 RepID=UPI00284D42ED|nr:HipA N-terminal domain-containing protein [Legionella sp.]
MKSLYVFYENQRVGIFSRDENLVSSFSYDEQWQASKNSFPLSLAMPLSQQVFNNKITLSFFENLLPEGDVRDTLERDHNIHGSFEFLEHFGQDCAGAIITADETFSYKPSNSHMKKINLEEIYTAISKKIDCRSCLSNETWVSFSSWSSALIAKRAKGLHQQGKNNQYTVKIQLRNIDLCYIIWIDARKLS